MGDPSSFTIKELTGDGREIILRGRALPYQEIVFEGVQKAQITRYPGNAVASIQMLGAEEKPSTFTGWWKDRFIKSVTDDGQTVQPDGVALVGGKQVADVMELAKTVDSVRLSGQQVQVTWDEITRVGVMTRFRQTWIRREDLKWEMEFEWQSRGEQEKGPSLPTPTVPVTLASQLRAMADEFTTAVQAGFQVVEEFSTAVEEKVLEIQTAVNEVEIAVQVAVDQAMTPLESAQRVLASVESIKTSCQNVIDLVDSVPARAVMSGADVSDSLADAINADEYTRGLKQLAAQMRALAADQSDTLRASTNEEEILAAFIAKAPTDLRDVSQQFYATPDEWRRIQQYNDFESSKVDAGTLVLVPKIQNDDRGT